MLCPCCKNYSGVRKIGMQVVRQTTFYYPKCKNHSKFWLLHAKAFERESKTNNEHTVAVLCQRHDFIPLYHFLIFCFLIRNFNSLFSSFQYRNLPENSHYHTFSMQHANKRRPIFSTNTLIPGTALIKNGSSFHHHAYSGQHIYSGGKSI